MRSLSHIQFIVLAWGLSASHALAQAPSDEALAPAAPPKAEAEESPAGAADVASPPESPEQEPVAPTEPPPSAEANEALDAPSGPAPSTGSQASSAAPEGEVGQTEGASSAAPTSPVAPSEESPDAEPAPINPRPAGEEELLGKHPIDSSKSTYKVGTGAVLESEDGKFSMGIRARVQFRDELEFRSEAVDDGMGGEVVESIVDNTFGIRRARLQLKGHVFGKHNKYKAEFAFSPNDLRYENGSLGFTPLLSYFAEFDHLRDLSFRIGQYKLFYNRQRVISSGDLEFVDRTTAQNQFNLDRDVGLHFFSEDLFGLGMFKYYAGISVGEGRDIWQVENLNDGGTVGAQYLARLEFLPFGDFEDYSEVDFERSNRFRLSVAAAYAFLDNGSKARGYQGKAFADGGKVDYHNAHGDVFFKWAGMTGLLEFYVREGQRDVTPNPGDTGNLAHSGLGGSVQLGYLLPGLPIGVGARYSGFGPGSHTDQDSALEEEHEVGGTVGWYMAGHPLKLQADYFHMWGDGIEQGRADRIRVQLQVAY